MKKKWLQVKVFAIHILQKIGILPKVWYQAEIDLAKIRGEEIYKLFNPDE